VRIYCDTSFLLSLYFDRDTRHPAAAREASRFTEGIPYTHLAELELTNSLRRLRVADTLDGGEFTAILSLLERDVRDGLLERKALRQAAHYQTAMEISARRMELSSRSLDILHVAAATVLDAPSFASFDGRQRELAKAEGLHLLPAKI